MSLTPVYLVPGVSLVDSPYAEGQIQAFSNKRVARGRWVGGDKFRFVAGFPEKMGGWVNVGQGSTLIGTPRVITSLRNSSAAASVVVGTTSHLYTWDGSTLTEVTPPRYILTTTNTGSITTSLNSSSIQVADSASTAVVGDWVLVSASAAVGGVQPNNYYQVTAIGTGTFTVTLPTAATSSTTGGGTVTVSYPRTNLTNPFATTSGSAVVTVTHAGHGALTGDYVDIPNVVTIGGIILVNQYQITVLNANSYTITASMRATSTTTGGGTVSVLYLASVGQLVVSGGSEFGTGAFGLGPYGFASNTVPSLFGGWSLDAYGSLMVCTPVGGTLYFYDSSKTGRAYPILNAPTGVLESFVTPERFIVWVGQESSTLEYGWCDQTDPTQWTTTATNTANSGQTLQNGSYLMGGCVVGEGISLLFSNRGVAIFQYNGSFTVYTVVLLADNAGLIGPHAAVTMGGVVYWMSDREFWMYNGAVQQIVSDDVHDYVFRNINPSYQSKCHAATNRLKREVWFFYPSRSATECDSYVIYHTDQQCWSCGTLDRSAWADAELFSSPIAASSTGTLYYHETGVDADGSAMYSYLESSQMDVSYGNQDMDIFGFVPDFQRLAGQIDLVIETARYPQDPETSSVTYTILDNDSTPRIDLRESGKLGSFMLSCDDVGDDFRLSAIRLDVQPAGYRL